MIILLLYLEKTTNSLTIDLRFYSELISALYLIVTADFIACQQFHFINSNTILDNAVEGATFILNSTFGPDELWDHLPRVVAIENCAVPN